MRITTSYTKLNKAGIFNDTCFIIVKIVIDYIKELTSTMKRKKTFKPQIESSTAVLPNKQLTMEEVLALPEDLFWAWVEQDSPYDDEIITCTPEQDEAFRKKVDAYVAGGKDY